MQNRDHAVQTLSDLQAAIAMLRNGVAPDTSCRTARLADALREHPIVLADVTAFVDRIAAIQDGACPDDAPGTQVVRFQPAKAVALTRRQCEILQWVARGKSNSSIACILGISVHTVDTHLRRIYNRLGTSDRTAAAIKAMQRGLIPAAA